MCLIGSEAACSFVSGHSLASISFSLTCTPVLGMQGDRVWVLVPERSWCPGSLVLDRSVAPDKARVRLEDGTVRPRDGLCRVKGAVGD